MCKLMGGLFRFGICQMEFQSVSNKVLKTTAIDLCAWKNKEKLSKFSMDKNNELLWAKRADCGTINLYRITK